MVFTSTLTLPTQVFRWEMKLNFHVIIPFTFNFHLFLLKLNSKYGVSYLFWKLNNTGIILTSFQAHQNPYQPHSGTSMSSMCTWNMQMDKSQHKYFLLWFRFDVFLCLLQVWSWSNFQEAFIILHQDDLWCQGWPHSSSLQSGIQNVLPAPRGHFWNFMGSIESFWQSQSCKLN